MCYALCVNIVGVNMSAEAQRGENADFSAGVEALNICCRVLFCVTVFLSELKCVVKAHALLYHFSQNKISCSV